MTEELDDSAAAGFVARFGEGSPYPDVLKRQRALRFLLKLILFLFIFAETIMVIINCATKVSYPWSLITGVSLLYIYLFLVYWVSHDAGFAAKVGLQILITMVFLFVIDYVNGMHGWSLQWAIPGIILAGDVLVFVLMILNRSRWQSYLLLLVFMGLCSLALVGLYFVKVIGRLEMPLLCTLVTGFYFLGTLLFGGGAAGRELSRRFHI